MSVGTKAEMKVRRLSTGVKGFDELIGGGIPEGFFVALVGEPGTGKTIFSIHYIAQGLNDGDKCIYVTTEESKESVIRQAQQFGFDFIKYIKDGKLIIIDALMKEKQDEWTIINLNIDELIQKVIAAKQKLGYSRARLVIDSLSAFFLDKPAMARRDSYNVKRTLYKWGLTVLATSQYAITTGEAFGWGIEHVADGIIRFRKTIKNGVLKRYIMVEKMRQTPHDLHLWEIEIIDGVGLVLLEKTNVRVEDYTTSKYSKNM
ncbi:MAG: KaiC domain-containing protein [Thermoprotei archaeon]